MDKKRKKKIQINNKNYKGLAEYYSQFYITDTITSNRLLSNYQLNYQYLHIAISKNGGFIAFCKVKDFFDIKNKASINDYLIVMYQDGKTVYKIPNNQLFDKESGRYVVSLEFNYKEQLYAFCNDGEIFKIDILKRRAKRLEIYHRRLDNEKVLKAKAFEQGFYILTGEGTIFYLKDLKNNENTLEFIVSLRDNLNIKEYHDCDFLIIPASETEDNSDEELLICKPNEEGVFLIKKAKISGLGFMAESSTQNYSKMMVNSYYINSTNVEKFKPKINTPEVEDFEVKVNEEKIIGPVSSIAISDSKKTIALYVATKQTVFIFSSKISSGGSISYKKLKYKIDTSLDEKEDANEKNNILNFKNKQLLFLSDDCVAICGGRWLIMINLKNETFVEDLNIDKSSEDTEPNNPHIYCKGISEVDGIRLMTKDEIILIRKMPNDIKAIYNIFGAQAFDPTKQILSSYEKYIANDPFCSDELRDIKDKLPEAILTLVKGSGFLYWYEEETDTFDKKELQNFFLKAANYAKGIFGKAEFNFDKFNNLCMNLRIVNALRNFDEKSRFLTLDEYESLISDQTDDILKKTMRQLNFKLAFDIAKFLGLPERDVYLKYAITKIRQIDVEFSQEANDVYNELIPMLKKLENISYIDIAKKCFKYNKRKLGHKFLDNERSSLVKIPQYLDLRDWENAIELAIQSNDINALNVVLDNVYKVESELSDNKKDINIVFVETFAKYPDIKIPVINYLKKDNKMEKDLFKYLEIIKDNDELFYLLLEKFFKSDSKKEREEILKKLKLCKPEKLDKKFYENYISDLEASFKFKKECLEKEIIGKDENLNIDNSVFDCFERAIPNNLEWVEKENKNNFKLSTRKITIIRFKHLFKNKEYDEIENIIKKGIKKLDISYIKIATMFFENGEKGRALEYAKKENKENLYEEKANFLIKMEEYEEAAKVVVKIKDQDKFEELANNIMNKVGRNSDKQNEIQEILNSRK